MRTALRVLVCAAFVATLTGCPRRITPGGRGASDIDVIRDMDVDDVLPSDRSVLDESRRVVGVEFAPVSFGYDSAQINPSETQKLVAVAEYLRRNPGFRVVVEGHCDERGSREYNLALGERRALAARAYLIGLGVDGQLVHTRSFGEERPLDPGHSEASWQRNRRAEFVLYR